MICTDAIGEGPDGKPQRHRARAYYRDFDGVSRLVEASGRTRSLEAKNLRLKLQNRASAGRSSDLTMMSGFVAAADLWLTKQLQMSDDGRRSPATVDTYRRQLKNHVLPAMGAVRLGEATTPLVDRVIAAIRTQVSPATAKSCKSAISGVMALAVRYGVITHNPVREIERIEASPRREPRALTGRERVELLGQLQADEKA